MRILVISRHLPYPLAHGRALIVYNVFKRLASRHTIEIIAFRRNEEDDEAALSLADVFTRIELIEAKEEERPLGRKLSNLCSWGSGFTIRARQPRMFHEFRERLESILSMGTTDVVHCSSLEVAEFLSEDDPCPRVLHLVDSATLGIRRQIGKSLLPRRIIDAKRLLWYLRMRQYERRIVGAFDATVTVGKKDYEVLKRLTPEAAIHLIPNGVDVEYFRPLEWKAKEGATIVFTGNMSFPPNVDAALYFYEEILPLLKKATPHIKFMIVGTSPSEQIRSLAKDRRVVVTGYVEDVRPYFAEADLVVCPMRIGSGIKNKILEAMAAGRPVVATSIGAEGIAARNGHEILIADGRGEFADAVVRLLADRSLWEEIVENARRLVEQSYTWEASAARYEKVFQDLLDASA